MEATTDMRSLGRGGWRHRRRRALALIRSFGTVLDRRRIAVGCGALVLLLDERELLARRLGLALAVPHAGIEAAAQEELLMRSALDDDAVVEHQDLVGAHDGRKPMRDHQRGAVLRHLVERVLD